MSPLPSPRETAEELQRVLEGRATAEETARQADLVRTVGLLTGHRTVEPRPAFSADLRERLMAAAATELVPDPTATVRALRPGVPARRRVGVVAASLVIVGTAAGAAAASDGALPGDPLYPVKRGTELVGTSVSLGSAQKGRSQLEHAGTRLQEARELLERDADDRLVLGALRDFQEEAAAGSERLFSAYDAEQRPEDVAAVRTFAADQMRQVDALAADADPVVAASLVDVADTLADLDAQAVRLCAQCSPGPELTTPTSVAAGAGGATVDSLLARPVAQARLDREALQALEADQLRRLREAAQRSAGDLGGTAGVQDSVPPVRVDQHGPVTSTLTTADAPTAPRLSGKPVRDLVDGVTGTVSGVTGTVGQVVPKTGTPVDDLAEDLDDTVSGVTGGLLP